jgi:anti-sigma B factor antagonist
MPRSFDIEIRADSPETMAVSLAGELDLAARPAVVERVTAALTDRPGVERVVIDLGAVSFCDSSGLGALLDIQRTAGQRGVGMVLRSLSPGVARVVAIAGVDDVLPQE